METSLGVSTSIPVTASMMSYGDWQIPYYNECGQKGTTNKVLTKHPLIQAWMVVPVPQSKCIFYDNGIKSKLHFTTLCKQFGIDSKSTTVSNAQANDLIKWCYKTYGNMPHTAGSEGKDVGKI